MNITEARQLLRRELDNHKLYNVEAKMNNRLTSAFGRYKYNRFSNYKVVELSTRLVSINDEARVRLTILHEIAHALTEGHGHDIIWKRKLLEIGGDGKRCYSSTDTNCIERPTRSKRYCLECQKCGYTGGIYRRRMNGYRHRGCGGECISMEIR